MFEKKIVFLKDIVCDDGNIMTYCQFIKIYGNICSIQSFNQLTASLPTNWKKKNQGRPSKNISVSAIYKKSKMVKKY